MGKVVVQRCELTYDNVVANDSGQCVVCKDWRSNHGHNRVEDVGSAELSTLDGLYDVTWGDGLRSIALAASVNVGNGAMVQRGRDGVVTLVVDTMTTMVLTRS